MQDLSQMSTEELLRMRDGARQQPAPPRGPVFGPAPAPPDSSEQQRLAFEAERLRLAQTRLDRDTEDKAPSGYRYTSDGNLEAIPGGPAAAARDGGSIPVSAAQVARESVGQYTSLERSIGTFKDDFAGNLGGELENTTEAYLGIGTEGQSEWWADFRATDNVIRNSLFGASLTEGEKAAYNATTVTPGMRPDKVRDNLARRAQIVRDALAREKEFYLANGYKPQAVEALFSPLGSRRAETQQSSPPPFDGDGNAALQSAFDAGASKEELIALAQQSGVSFPAGQDRLDELLQYRDGGGQGASFVRVPDSPPSPDGPSGGGDPLASETFGEFGRTMNTIGALGARGITLGLSDEASGVGGAIGALLTGGDVSEGYTNARNAENVRIEAARENAGFGALPLEIAGGGGALRIAGGIPRALNAARGIQATGQPVTRQGVQRALTIQSAKEGAGIGALAGAASGDTMQERGANALSGLVLGGALGGGGQAVSNRLANRLPGQSAAVQQAADRLGVPVIPAVTGGTTTQRVTAGARQGFISDRPIAKAVEGMEAGGMAARDRIAGGVGQVLDAEDAGNVIRQAGKVFSERTSAIGGKLYERAENRAGNQKFPLQGGVTKADEWLTRLGESVQGENGTIYKEVKALRDAMARGDFGLMSIPRTRDEFRAQIQERGLRGSTLDTAVKQILDASEDDILNGLRQSGNDAAVGAFQTATKFWAKRVSTIDEFLSPVLGKNTPKSGEQVVTALERLANPKTGNATQLKGVLDAMPKAESASVRATLINRMGRATSGASQNADDGTFSFDTFMTNWNNMSPRAKAIVFPKDSREALNGLATISRAVKVAGSATNTSNTAGALTVQAALSGGLWYLEPMTAIGAAGGQYAVGRLLASPKFARLLSGAPKQGAPQARRAFSARLGNLAQSEPTLAREIGIYQRALAANDNNAVGNIAAEQENQPPGN